VDDKDEKYRRAGRGRPGHGEVVGIAPTIQEFFDNLTEPFTSEKVVGADFDFPSYIIMIIYR
jgi:hypothetical protein